MDIVRFGIIGLGGMGSFHLGYLPKLATVKVAALCDADPKRLAAAGEKQPDAGTYATYEEVLTSGKVDAILIATPHYQHPEITVAAFDRGLHVLTEKPAAVTVKGARAMNAAHARRPDLKFGIMFQMRTNPMYQKLRQLIADGELGELQRITWIITNWFRTCAYYASGGWRATWEGEGGGVLLNQCPHNLDLLHWITGLMPRRVTAIAALGKYHPIEVEDEVSAILEYDNGAVGHFITTTGEAPGANRLEIVGDRGKLVAEAGKLRFSRTRTSVRQFRETDPGLWSSPETWEIEVPFSSIPESHQAITENFVSAILKGAPLLAPGEDGLKGLEIGNAMLMAGVTRRPVEIPVDGDAYETLLADLANRYRGRKPGAAAISNPPQDMASSFAKA